jgi:hypothetical protein
MKGLLFLAFLFPLQLAAQDLAGVWVGILHNDTTDMDLHYEIIISEHKGKLSGFSYTNFIVDGRSYTGVKSLTISKRFGKLYVEDDKLVYNNYDFEPPKGVKQASILETSDVEVMLSGRFVTTRTKQYGKQVTGHIYLLKKPDPDVSKLMEILKGLDLATNLSFLPKEEVAAAPVITPKETAEQPIVKSKEKPKSVKEEIKTVPPVVKETMKPAVKKEETTVAPVTREIAKPTVEQRLAVRKIETVQTIYFTSDSLVLELYDNGYVDGDSVSIVVNGKAFLTNIRLSEKASVKTIRITPGMDSVNLVMFAENLGTISPNSGLAIIRDGKKEYRVAFSGDLQKNAAIVLRRKKE